VEVLWTSATHLLYVTVTVLKSYDVRCAIATQNKMTGFMVESGHFYPALHGLGYACSRELLYDGAGVAVEIIAT